jgi:hypothetical protein
MPLNHYSQAYAISFPPSGQVQAYNCTHQHLYNFMYTLDNATPIQKRLFRATYKKMAGFPFEGGCAKYDNADTGKIAEKEQMYTGMENYGRACGYDVTYLWVGADALTVTIHTDESMMLAALSSFMLLAFQAFF